MIIAFLMAINVAVASIDDVVNSGLAQSKSVFSKSVDELGQHIPKYEPGIESKTASEFAGINDSDLKQKGQASIPKIPVISETMKKDLLPNYENSETFKMAERVWADPAASLKNLLQDCAEKTNKQTDPYSKRNYKKLEKDEDEEIRTCEKPNQNIKCEKTLELKCDATVDCDGNGIIVSSIKAEDIEWKYQNSHLHLGTIGDNYWGGGCDIYDRAVKFKIKNKHLIKELKLDRVSYDDFLWIKVNGNTVYIGPYGGTELTVTSKGGWFRRRSVVSNGQDTFGCEQGASRNDPEDPTKSLNIDLTSYLKEDDNEIWTRTIVGGRGEFYMKVKARQHCCSDVKEIWVKRCF